MLDYEIGKRILDVVLALLLVVLFSPLFLIVPLIIKLTSSGSVVYGQKRVGKNGREFIIYKFRSMIQGADDVLTKDEKDLTLREKKFRRRYKESDWKLDMEDDPRITKFGKLMRSLTIDEFPQLWNVLKGEMSIVGPRAYRAQEIRDQSKKYPEATSLVKEILTVRPGITGPWQTSGRNEVPFLKRAKMDAEYARRRSLWGDIKILFKTPPAMFSRW